MRAVARKINDMSDQMNGAAEPMEADLAGK